MVVTLHLLYYEEVFRQNITGRSSDWRIILLIAPSPHRDMRVANHRKDAKGAEEKNRRWETGKAVRLRNSPSQHPCFLSSVFLCDLRVLCGERTIFKDWFCNVRHRLQRRYRSLYSWFLTQGITYLASEISWSGISFSFLSLQGTPVCSKIDFMQILSYIAYPL